MIEAYITNLGRYNEGHHDGEFLKLPANKEDVDALLKRIHVDGLLYEEVFISTYECNIPGLSSCLGEYESIDELNYLATLLEDMEDWDIDKFAAAVEFGEYTSSVKELINLAQNLNCYELYAGIGDAEDLGYYYIEEMCSMEIPEHMQNYFDYEAYGRDIYLDESGMFVDGGYIVDTGDSFTEHYSGRDDIPEECRIFSVPKPERVSIGDMLEGYQAMIDSTPAQAGGRQAPVQAER